MCATYTSPREGDILIIDDTPANLQLLTSILHERGYGVRAVVDGAMGLIAAKTLLPDLILLDIKMPGLNGYEVCKQLKATEVLRNIPVIFISSADETMDKVQAFQVGAVDYITKPFQVEEVIARVTAQLIIFRAHQQSIELAMIKERQRLARDLHDAVSQTIFSIGMLAETSLFRQEFDPQIMQNKLEQILSLAHAANAEMRVLLFELRPEHLVKVDLADLLQQLADLLTKRLNAKVLPSLQRGISLPSDVRITLYRIAQEAINNIIKHSCASRIQIELQLEDDVNTKQTRLYLAIIDNGKGFSLANEVAGFGIANMFERASLINATLDVVTQPNKGTALKLYWYFLTES